MNPQETPEAHAGGEQANQEKESEKIEKQDLEILEVRVMLALLDMFFHGSLSFPMFSLCQLSELSR